MDTQLLIEIILAVIFVISMVLFVIIKRKNISIQKVVSYFLYLIIYRSNLGLNFMKKTAKKHRAAVQLFGYSCIGIGLLGMIYISITIIYMIYNLIVTPTTEAGFALVLPFTNIPGIGYLYFSTWIVAIFLLALVHEFSHGIVAESHDVKVKSSGIVFFSALLPIVPGAFVEPDEKQLSKKPDAVQYSVFAAGPVINIIIAMVLLFTMPFVHPLNTMQLAPYEDIISEPIGLSFEAGGEDYPAAKAGMTGGIIKEVDGKKVTDFQSFIDSTYGIRPGEEYTIRTDKDTYNIVTVEHPEDSSKGYIGIKFIANERRIKPEYEWIKHPYYWVKDFLKWFFIFNFAIGLFNLLPLGIVDGGRMTKIYLDRSNTDKKKSAKIWTMISLFFLALLLFGLITTYIGNPFSWLQ